MKKYLAISLLLGCLILIVLVLSVSCYEVAPTTPSLPTEPNTDIPSQSTQTKIDYTNQEVEELIFTLINNERQKVGLEPLVEDSLLTDLATSHSFYMAYYCTLTHERFPLLENDFDYGQPQGTIRGENIIQIPCQEYVPGPYLTLQELCEWAVSSWMSSEGHRENILDPNFTRTGVGVCLLTFGETYLGELIPSGEEETSQVYEDFYISQMFEGEY